MSEFTISQSATAEETAAIAAAVQRFSQDTAIAAPAEPAGMDPWLRAALEEGVSAKESFGPGQPFGSF
jgi:hypothetical protein